MTVIRFAVAILFASTTPALAQEADAPETEEATGAETTPATESEPDPAGTEAASEATPAETETEPVEPEPETTPDSEGGVVGGVVGDEILEPATDEETVIDDRPTVAPPPAPQTEVAPILSIDEEAPPPPVVLERIPPRFSYEFAVHASYGSVATFNDTVPNGWVGLGLRGGWGKNFGRNRIGPGVVISLEGPVPIHWSLVIEPAIQWDHITLKGFAVGASLSPAFLVNTGDVKGTFNTTTHFAPVAALRIGYSQTWSRIGRRFFIYVEPRFRYVVGADNVSQSLNPLVAIVVGSGRGY